MQILLLGKNGQVGKELQRALEPIGRVFAPNRIGYSAAYCGDVCDFAGIGETIDRVKPDIVVNASAYTAVDRAESEKETVDRVNHLAVKNIADCCSRSGSLLIHYSTDYVFDGEGTRPWREDDKTNPVNFYGFSKRAGEVALEQSAAKFMNFRTSWVHGLYGANFIRAMLNLGSSREELKIVSDQVGAPTDAALIADITAHALQQWKQDRQCKKESLVGHYHLTAAGRTDWCEYARFVFDVARSAGFPLKVRSVAPITTSEYPTPAHRPLNSRLNTEKLRKTFDLSLPEWKSGVERNVKIILKGMS